MCNLPVFVCLDDEDLKKLYIVVEFVFRDILIFYVISQYKKKNAQIVGNSLLFSQIDHTRVRDTIYNYYIYQYYLALGTLPRRFTVNNTSH